MWFKGVFGVSVFWEEGSEAEFWRLGLGGGFWLKGSNKCSK